MLIKTDTDTNSAYAAPESTPHAGAAAPATTVATPSVADYYKQLHARCTTVLEQTFADSENVRLQANNHAFIQDFAAWVNALAARPEASALDTAIREYQYGLMSVAQGFYRQSFMALRFFLESVLCTINMSYNELELRLWIASKRHLSWKAVMDKENGPFSAKVSSVFCPEIESEAEAYRSLAEMAYHESSEYVHHHPRNSAGLPQEVEYSETIYRGWQELANTVQLIITFTLTARYFHSLTPEARTNLEPVILDQLNHIAAIRDLFNA